MNCSKSQNDNRRGDVCQPSIFDYMDNPNAQPYLHDSKYLLASFIFANIFGIFNHSRFDRAASKHFPNPQPKEVHHENFPVCHPFFQLPTDEREKKIRCGTMNSSLGNFQNHFGEIELSTITSEDILAFMSTVTDGTKQNTKKLRFTLLSAFFNLSKIPSIPKIKNPCDNPALRKLFRAGKPTQLKILEKDVVDEIIFRTRNPAKPADAGAHGHAAACESVRS